jgi:hypothetical protein
VRMSALPIQRSGEDLGRAIRRRRRAAHMTIEDLAYDADMHPTYLSGSSVGYAIRRGTSCVPWYVC